MKNCTVLAICTSLAVSLAAHTPSEAQSCGSATKEAAVSTGDKLPTIVSAAISSERFSTLVAALKAGGLVEALQGDGPFTVFAPTNAAFEKLPAETLATLLKPENKAQLASILTYHVVSGTYPAEAVTGMGGAITLNGQRISFSADDSGVRVNEARVLETDLRCANGVIHVIDSVILPTSKNIVATASAAGTFSTLLTAATAAGLADVLQGEGPFTVFAPTDAAFAKLPAGTVENLLKPENKDQLVKVLKFHVVAGRVYAEQAEKAMKATTLANLPLTFSKGKSLAVNGAKIVRADLDASNGVIHVVDSVLLP